MGQYRLFAMSRTNNYSESNIFLSPSITRIQCDLSLRDTAELSEPIDVVIHAAGQAHMSYAAKNHPCFINNNVTATRNLLNILEKHPIKKVIYLSTVAVLNPTEDIYAQTKWETEQLVVKYCHDRNINYICLRPVAIYGEGDTKGNVYKLIRQLEKGFFPLINGGENKKDLLYVGNLVETVVRTLESSTWDNQLLIIKNRESVTLSEFCHMLQKKLGSKAVFISIPGWVIKGVITVLNHIGIARLAHVNTKSIDRLSRDVVFDDLSQLNRELLRRQTCGVFESIQKVCQWYKNQNT